LRFSGARKRSASCRNQVIGTFGATRASGAQVTLFNQPDLSTCHVRPFHRALDKSVQEFLQRVLVRHLQQYLRGVMMIEAVFTRWFHNRS